MASITYWNRVEPRPRSNTLKRALAAQIRGPMWFLTRQYQFGEFGGRDAASAAYVQFSTSCSRMQSWQTGGGQPQSFEEGSPAPLEALVQTEPFSPDLATAVELGQKFETLLAEQGLTDEVFGNVIKEFRQAYPIAQITEVQITANDTATNYKITIRDESVSVSGNAGGASFTAADLVSSLQATTNPYFRGITWSQDGDKVIGTSTTAIPFAFSASTQGGNGTFGPVRNEPGTDKDPELARFLRVCAGRAIHGIKLYEASEASQPDLPPQPPINPMDQLTVRAVKDALSEFRAWVKAIYGTLAEEDAPAWLPEHLEYEVQVSATSPSGGSILLKAHAGRQGEFDWYAFDQIGLEEADKEAEIDTRTRSLLPIHVRFPAMSNDRWWQFERGLWNIGDIKVDRAELAKIILVDFILVHSNDWFVVPFTQEVGTLCRINALLVHDVFGDVTLVGPADRHEGSAKQCWSIFSTTVRGENGGLADYFILPPSAPSSTLHSDVIEEVRFVRDEMFNSAWAVEHITENGLGRPWPGHERVQQSGALIETPRNETESPLKYVIQTSVPEHWIPFLPVRTDDSNRAVNFERASMLRPSGDGSFEPVLPVGRILRPNRLVAPNVYQVKEEEIPRTGVRVSKLVRRTRWIDGSTHMWITRAKGAAAREGSPGLRFDITIPKRPGEAGS